MTNITAILEDDLAAFDAQSGDKPQLLVFSATWCGPCKAMVPTIEDVAEAHADAVTVARIDIERSPAVAAAFNVRSVPTIVLRKDREEVTRHVGAMTRTRLEMMLDARAAEARS